MQGIVCTQDFIWAKTFEGERGGRGGLTGCLSSGCRPHEAWKLKHNFISEFSKSHLRNNSGDLIARTQESSVYVPHGWSTVLVMQPDNQLHNQASG